MCYIQYSYKHRDQSDHDPSIEAPLKSPNAVLGYNYVPAVMIPFALCWMLLLHTMLDSPKNQVYYEPQNHLIQHCRLPPEFPSTITERLHTHTHSISHALLCTSSYSCMHFC